VSTAVEETTWDAFPFRTHPRKLSFSDESDEDLFDDDDNFDELLKKLMIRYQIK
jgi:hypothetical protein